MDVVKRSTKQKERRSLKYDAFISYSHKADAPLAEALERHLEKFAKPWYRLRSANVFRDETSLATSPNLWPTIVANLDESAYLILLASTAAADSKWVCKELSYWITDGACDEPDTLTPTLIQQDKVERVFLVLTEGDIAWDDSGADFNWKRTTALPTQVLSQVFAGEPLWVDLRWARASENPLDRTNEEFMHAIAKLSAPIRDLDIESLIGADFREHRRSLAIFRWLSIGLAFGILLAVIATGVALVQRNEAVEARKTADQQTEATQYELYAVRASQLEQTWTAGNLDQLPAFLSEAQMSHEGVDLRGFEWFLYNRLASAQMLSVRPEIDGVSGSGLGQLRCFTVSHDDEHIAIGWRNAVSVIRLRVFKSDAHRILTELASVNRRDVGDAEWRKGLAGVDGVVAMLFGAPYEALGFCPNGEYLVAAGDQATHAWDTASWTRIPVPTESGCYSICFSRDSKIVALGAFDNTVKVLRVPEFQLWHSLEGHTQRVTAVDIRHSHDDGAVIGSSSTDGTTRIWDIAGETYSSVELSHDVLPERMAPVNDLCFSNGGKAFATAGDDGVVNLRFGFAHLDYRLTTQTSHADEVWSIAFSPNDKLLIAGDRSGVLRINNIDIVAEPKVTSTRIVANVADLDVEPFDATSANPEAVVHIEFTRDSRFAIALSNYGRIRIFDVGKLAIGYTPRWQGHSTSNNGVVRAVRFTTDGQQLVAAENNRLSVATLSDGTWSGFSSARSIDLHVNEFTDESRSKRTLILDQTESQYVQQMRLESETLLGSTSKMTSVAFGRDLTQAITGHQSGEVSIWTLKPLKRIRSFQAHEAAITGIAFLDDRAIATCGSGSKSIEMWSSDNDSLLKQLEGHAQQVTCLLASSDGRRLFSGSDDATIRIWDVVSGHAVATLRKHSSGIRCLALTSGDHTLASGGADQNVVFWQTKNN